MNASNRKSCGQIPNEKKISFHNVIAEINEISEHFQKR
jgi:hypothetical protein